jgi:magnesium transporter
MADNQEELKQNMDGLPVEEEYYSYAGNLMDSRVSRLDDLLLVRLEEAFEQSSESETLHEISKIISETSALDIAYAVTSLPLDQRFIIFKNLEKPEDRATFIIETDNSTRSYILRQLESKEMRLLIEHMPADEAAWILEYLSRRQFKEILEILPLATSERICEILQHKRNTAGRLMTKEYFAFTMETTIGQVAAVIRDNPQIDFTRRVFVIDKEGHLMGYVPDRTLIINRPSLPLKQVMQPVSHEVYPDATREEVIDLVERYKISALPVVENDVLIGVITYEDIVEAMEDVAGEMLASMAGTGEDIDEKEPLLKRFMLRTPWLLVTLFAGLVTSTGLQFLANKPWFAFVPFFMQLILGMSGNVGIQCSTILVRSMATGELSPGSKGDAIAKELALGMSTGAAFGIFCGGMVYILNYVGLQHIDADPVMLGLMVCGGLFGACLTSTILGVFSPFFFARLGVDPAIAAGPIVTACNDVLSTFIFCLVVYLVSFLFI